MGRSTQTNQPNLVPGLPTICGWSGGAKVLGKLPVPGRPANLRGGRVVRWCWVNFQFRGVLLIWIRVGQGPSVLAVGAGRCGLDFFFSRLSFPFSFSLSLGDGPI